MKKIIVAAVMAFVGVAAFAQPKFAHVNYAELVQLCPEADSARATMTASSNEAQATYQAMVEEFNAKYEDYQSKAGTWTASIRQTKADGTEARYGLNSESQMLAFLQALDKAVKN